MKYRCMALDMDGTLLNGEGKLSPVVRSALQEAAARGVTVMLASGRAKRQIVPYADELGLATPIAANNGAQTWLDAETLLSEHRLDAEWVDRLLALAVKAGIRYWGHGLEGSFYSGKPEPFPPVHSVNWLQFAVESPDGAVMAAVRDEVQRWEEHVEISRANPQQCEINAKGVSKASGVEELCRQLGIRMEQVIAVGDGMNDALLLQAAGLGVAMGNSEASVKQAADVTAPTTRTGSLGSCNVTYSTGNCRNFQKIEENRSLEANE